MGQLVRNSRVHEYQSTSSELAEKQHVPARLVLRHKRAFSAPASLSVALKLPSFSIAEASLFGSSFEFSYIP